MRTNIDIDDQLIEQVRKVAHLKTKKEAVHLALENYLMMLRRKKLLQLKGKVKWVGDLKAMRSI